MYKKKFILYKINQIPGDASSLVYLKGIKYNRPVYTNLKEDAARLGLLKALIISIRFGFSTIPERLS